MTAKKKDIFVVVRKCCLGPNCDRNHGATFFNSKGQKVDKRVLVYQYATRDRDQANRVAQNWIHYQAVVEVYTPKLLEKLAPDSAAHLQEKVKRNLIHPDY